MKNKQLHRTMLSMALSTTGLVTISALAFVEGTYAQIPVSQQGYKCPNPTLCYRSEFQSDTPSSLNNVLIPQQLIAFKIPSLQPKASVTNGVLQVAIPVSLLEGPINSILRANGGRYKDTDFQQFDVNDMRVSFTEGGLVINGNWRFQAREYLGSLFGRKKYTPWVSVSGSFSQPFSVRLRNGRLFAEAGKTNIQGANKWYGDILDALISRFRVNGAVNQRINEELQNFNGMNVQQLLVQSGSASVAQALGISSNNASQLINSRVGNINANISGGSLRLFVPVR